MDLDGPNTLWNLYGAKNTLILCLASRKEVDLDETTTGPNEALLSPFDDAALFLSTLIRAIVTIFEGNFFFASIRYLLNRQFPNFGIIFTQFGFINY